MSGVVALIDHDHRLPLFLLPHPSRDFLPKLFLDDATDVTGILDVNNGPVLSDLLQWYHVHALHWIAIADQDLDGYLDLFQFLFRHREFADALNEGGRSAPTFGGGHPVPESLERSACAQPTHAANRPGQRAAGVLGQKLEGDHASRGIA